MLMVLDMAEKALQDTERRIVEQPIEKDNQDFRFLGKAIMFRDTIQKIKEMLTTQNNDTTRTILGLSLQNRSAPQKEEQQALSEEFQVYYSALNEKEKAAHARVMEEYRTHIKPIEALIEQFHETYRTRFSELA